MPNTWNYFNILKFKVGKETSKCNLILQTKDMQDKEISKAIMNIYKVVS